MNAKPITVRREISDAGICSAWLVGEWPELTMISPILFTDPPWGAAQMAGEVTFDGVDIHLAFINAVATYHVVEREPIHGDFIAKLVEAH